MGLHIDRGVKDINPAQFVDDTLLSGGARNYSARKFKKGLDLYQEVSGSKINYRKIQIYRWNCTPKNMLEISRILEIEGKTQWDSFKYLGIPIIIENSKCAHYLPLLDKLKKN